MRLRFRTTAVLLLLAAPAAAQQKSPGSGSIRQVDSIFARFSTDRTPGCAVGVTREGDPLISRAYGMAELEHGVLNTPQTVFEAGSVSKQLTAAAVVLLAQEGRLSLDDDIRKYIPELPDYGTPITIRHLLNHTSGLRDWGSVAAIGGWPRGSRVHTHDHMLDIASRQRSLNYAPGEHYSYTNTGYNLQAILVERVTGMPFAEFSRTRIFEPLGMTNTQWRDDYTRVVKGRATAYEPAPGGGYRLDMPFENVHGNGGLLTTVGDLLRWTAALESGKLGGPGFITEMHRRGILNSGREIEYASGLFVTRHRNVPEISHSGATAGYRAFLARYPEEDLAIAVLCNAANASAPGLAHQVVDLLLGDAQRNAPEPKPARLAPALLSGRAGLYRDTRTGQPLRLVANDSALRVQGGPPLIPRSATRFQAGSGMWIEFDASPPRSGRVGFHRISADGDTVRYEPVPDFAPTSAQLAEYAGTYHSDEAERVFTVAVKDASLVLRDRYGEEIPLEPAYPDAFTSRSGMFRFIRDETGRVTQMSSSSSRVWDLRFERRP